MAANRAEKNKYLCANVKTDRKRMLLLNDPYTTVSGHFNQSLIKVWPLMELYISSNNIRVFFSHHT